MAHNLSSSISPRQVQLENNADVMPTKIGQVHIRVESGERIVDINTRKPVFILGRNGTGKSALVHLFFQQLQDRCVYVPGSRPNYFDNEGLNLTPANRRDASNNIKSWNQNLDIRWRSIGGNLRGERAIYDLQTAETQFKIDAANKIKLEGASSSAISVLQSSQSPLDRLNAIFRQAGLPIRMIISDGEIKAQQSGSTYSFARLSDGERAALLLGAEIITAKPASIFLLDEPELHLHRAISVPLLAAVVAERPDCAFMVSTHELFLASEISPSTAVLVRGAQWSGQSVNFWHVDVVESLDSIPESLRFEIYGARKKLLFVEGTSSSLDQPIYSILFPSTSIASRESCRAVVNAVTVLDANKELHHTDAFGLVDNDGMSTDRVEKLERSNVFALPIYSVESLYYDKKVLNAVARRQAETLGSDADALVANAEAAALNLVDDANVQLHLAAKRSHNQIRETLLNMLPKLDELKADPNKQVSITMAAPLEKELETMKRLIQASDVHAIIARYPIRDSRVLGTIAVALKFQTRADYEKAALARIQAEPELATHLKELFGALAPLLH